MSIHISIEGADGVGKTTISRALAEKTKYQFIEKPIHMLFKNKNAMEIYLDMIQKVNSYENKTLRAMFYGFSNILVTENMKDVNYITDRYILSNLCWQKTNQNKVLFDFIIQNIKIPDLTVILTANEETINGRIKTRNPNDPDLIKVQNSRSQVKEMIQYANEYNIPYIEIDTSKVAVCEIVDEIINKLKTITE